MNNAADTSRGSLEDAPVELWDAIMQVNLRAPFLCLQEAVRSMKARGGGSVVNIGSVNAYIGEPKLGPYSVSKGGLMTLTRNAAAALASYRIRVNQINVGWTLTEGEARVKRTEGKRDDWLEAAVASRPFGRLLSPQDVAHAAAYFASDDSALVSGTVMDLEAGTGRGAAELVNGDSPVCLHRVFMVIHASDKPSSHTVASGRRRGRG